MQKLKWLPGILAILSLVAEMALNLLGSNPHLAAYLAIVLLLVQVAILYLELENIKNVRPKIDVFAPPYEDTRPLVQINARTGSQTVTTIHCFHMTFANNPKSRTEQATARKVFAQLTYYTQSKNKLIGPIYGRWGDTEQPGTRSPFAVNRDLLSVDLESSGLSRELNLAIKHPQEKTIYAFNNDSYPYEGWRNPAFAINKAKVIIHVRLSGENVDNTNFWLLLKSKRDTQTIELTVPLDIPKK